MTDAVVLGAPEAPPDAFNLADYVLTHASEDPDKMALAIVSPRGAARWRYGALRQAVSGIASGLLARGLSPGDRVLMRLGNEVDFPLCYLGAIWAGLIPIPASAGLTEREIGQIAKETRPSIIVAAPDVSLPPNPACPVLPALALRDMEALPPAKPARGPTDRPAYIVFTSGSSGRPRGVVHAHRAIWARRMMWQGWYGLGPTDRLMHAGAFNWTFTLGTGLMDPWAMGATALVPEEGTSPAQLPLLLRRFDATILAAAPGVYRQMLRNQDRLDLPKLRHGLTAGEKLPEALRSEWTRQTGTSLHEALGMSECSTFVSGSPSRPAPRGTTGYAQKGRSIAVLDETDAVVPRDTEGELAVHATDPGLMLGYLGEDGHLPDGIAQQWFKTGDRVVMAQDGAITYLGRSDDMMNAGGYRVAPLEVEAALAEHPGVSEVACAAVEVKADTQVIAAFYTGPRPVPEQELSAHAAERLARYKQPRMYVHLDAMPRAGNGKLNRRALAARI